MERELRDLTRVVVTVGMVLHHGERKVQPDLRTRQPDARSGEHRGAHRLDEFVQRVLAQLPVVLHALRAQHRLAGLDDRQYAVVGGFEQPFHIPVERHVDALV